MRLWISRRAARIPHSIHSAVTGDGVSSSRRVWWKPTLAYDSTRADVRRSGAVPHDGRLSRRLVISLIYDLIFVATQPFNVRGQNQEQCLAKSMQIIN